MSIFDLFGKKKKVIAEDPDTFLQEELKRKLEEKGHSVRLEDGSVFVDKKIEILTTIIDNPELHPHILHLHTVIVAGNYFPRGLTENLVGMGETMHEKVESALNNFLTVSLPPVLDAFTDSHYPGLDFETETNGREILWHPKIGNFGLQGKWTDDERPKEDYFLELLKEKLKPLLIDRKFNWLKIYLAKQKDGEINGDCSLNNEFWEEGFKIIEESAKLWDNGNSSFRGIKQFILFRMCDASEKE